MNTDRPIVYDRNSRQVLPYGEKPVCAHLDTKRPYCVGADKPESDKALKPKHTG